MDINLLNFIREWNSSLDARRTKIFMRPETEGEDLYNVEFRFSKLRYTLDEESFNQIKIRIYNNSRNLMQVTSSYDEFLSGIFRTAVLFCNHGYSPKVVANTLNDILIGIFPTLKRAE